MKAFLVEFDRETETVTVSSFEDRAEGLRVLREHERDRRSEVEVVLLFADAEHDLHRTHARYFKAQGQMLDGLASDASGAGRAALVG